MRNRFKILSINISEKKGEHKKPVAHAFLKPDHGIQGDAHAGNWHRQVSLLADEDIETMRGTGVDIDFGDFAENIATQDIDWKKVAIGTRVKLGESAVVEITQIGKECHQGCAIFQAVGDCVMPRKGVFAIVLKGGGISPECECFYEFQ